MTENQHILNSAVFTLSSAILLQSFFSLSLLSPVLCPSILLHPNILCCSLSFHSPAKSRSLSICHFTFQHSLLHCLQNLQSVTNQLLGGVCMFVCLFVWGRCVGVSGSCSIVYVYESLICQQFGSVQFRMVVVRPEKPICVPPHSSKVSLLLLLKQFQCSSD